MITTVERQERRKPDLNDHSSFFFLAHLECLHLLLFISLVLSVVLPPCRPPSLSASPLPPLHGSSHARPTLKAFISLPLFPLRFSFSSPSPFFFHFPFNNLSLSLQDCTVVVVLAASIFSLSAFLHDQGQGSLKLIQLLIGGITPQSTSFSPFATLCLFGAVEPFPRLPHLKGNVVMVSSSIHTLSH